MGTVGRTIGLIICAALLVACNRRQPAVRTPSLGSGSIGSLDHTIWYVIQPDGSAGPMVWVDAGGSCTGSSAIGHASGKVTTPNGATILIQYQTTGADPGSIVINGEKFAVAQGSIFLVHSRENPIRMAQVSQQPSASTVRWENVEKLSETNPEIRQFLADARAAAAPTTAPTTGAAAQ